MADVCKEYGGALYLLAAETEAEKIYFEQLIKIKGILKENISYVKLLSSPSLGSNEKKALIEQAFGGKIEEYILNFMLLMCERGYFGYMIGCIDHFKKVYFEKRNISEGIVKSAYALSDEEKEAIRKATEKKMSGKTLILDFLVDKSVLGGFYVEADGKVFDSTVKTKLAGLKNTLSKPI